MSNNDPEMVPQPAKQQTTSLEMILAQLEQGNGISSKLNDNHIDKLIDQRGKIIEKVSEDRSCERWDGKFYFIIAMVATLIILAGVLFFKPEYFPQAMTALLSGGGGFGIGYGVAKGDRI